MTTDLYPISVLGESVRGRTDLKWTSLERSFVSLLFFFFLTILVSDISLVSIFFVHPIRHFSSYTFRLCTFQQGIGDFFIHETPQVSTEISVRPLIRCPLF